jgi:putative hemin transport protein
MLNESSSSQTANVPVLEVRQAWQRLHESEPDLRARDLAERIGVSEGELVASRCGEGITRLQGPWQELIHALPVLGRVMVLTRNDSCVHEKKGTFANIGIGGAMGVVLDEAIDLRLFLTHWKHGFAVQETSRGRLLHSLQFFDADGQAVHKIYRTDDSDLAAWDHLVGRYSAAVQSPVFERGAVQEALPQSLQDDDVDASSLREGWRAMRDPHDFFALLKKHRVTRTQALRVAGAEFAQRVGNQAIGVVLESAAASGLPIMVFVGSPGVVQIHTGPVQNIQRMGPWLNVLDTDFNLHLREDHIAESWVVRKPTPEDPVTSLDLYDARGRQILQVFGKRKPGIPELKAWRALADSLSRVEHVHE